MADERDHLAQEVDRAVLRAGSVLLAALYLVYAPAHAILLPDGVAGIMVAVALVSSGLLALEAYQVWGDRLTHSPGGGVARVAGLVLLNSVLILWLTREPIQTTNLVLLVVGAALVTSSFRLFVAVVVATWMAWLPLPVVVRRIDPGAPSELWTHLGFALLASTALASVVMWGKDILLGRLARATVTERVQTRISAARRRLYHGIFEASPGLLALLTRDGEILSINELGARALGHAPHEMVGRSMGSFLSTPLPDWEELVISAVGEGRHSLEMQSRTDDVRRFRVRGASFQDETGARRLILAGADVTDLLEAKRALAVANLELGSRHEAVLAALPDSLFLVDDAGRFLGFRAGQGARIFGDGEPQGIPGRTLEEVFPREVATDLRARIGAVREGESVQPIPFNLPGAEGFRRLEVRVARCRVDETLLLVRDVTRETRLEDQLRQAQRLESVGLLAGGIAHDFNNVLMAIHGLAELLELAMKPDDAGQQEVRRILEAAQRGAQVTRRILTFSRPQRSVVGPVAIGAVVRNATDFLRSSVSSDIEIRSEVPESLGTVEGDRTQLEQVLVNLGTNAAHAMEEAGGTLRVTARRSSYLPAPTTSDGPGRPTPKPAVRIEVRDSGVGIPAEELVRIFDPFYSTKAMDRGTGLGLSVAHGIVVAHGGRIEVDSEPGRGSTFSVILPLSEAEDGSGEEEGPGTGAAPRGSGEPILLLDDEVAIVRVLARHLERAGYAPTPVSDPETALELLARGGWRLLITDYSMPGMNGVAVAERARAFLPGLPVLLISGHLEGLDSDRLRRELGIVLLPKPFGRETLLALVEASLG